MKLTQAQPWCTLLLTLRCKFFAGLALLVLAVPWSQAQSIETVLRPGELVQGHAKWDEDCAKCHVRFDRAAQDRLCTDCHKDVGQDMRERSGFHGRQKAQACSSCHTDHKGRQARIVLLDKQKFDHAQTDFVLRGKHARVECDKCHEPNKKYSQAPLECNACHRKDDTHKGSLGPKCGDCHTENNWKETRVDHDKTRFPLTGKHVDTRCVDCHKDTKFKETPLTCVACHRADDDRKGHKGLFGARCETCHGTKSWKDSIFNHDTETKFALRLKHRSIKCTDCHTKNLYKDKVGSACIDCHRKDDKHKGSLGVECAACHTERNWKETPKFSHDRTKFPLLGKHQDIKCEACHKSSNLKEAPKDCFSCHKKDDKHESNLGVACGECHIERDWKTTTRFDHDKSKFKLRNAHAAKTLQCKACHVDLKHYRNSPTDCFACHKKDDKHQGQQGTRCADCHSDSNWNVANFDHRATRFPLVGKHVSVACTDCHVTPRYKDALRECYACHKKDDTHKLTFGATCETCHNARNWRLWDYDHLKRARFALDGAHAKIDCKRCHNQPAPAGKNAGQLGNTCIACHQHDDTHDGAFGRACERCHVTDKWKQLRPEMSKRISSSLGEPLDADASAWALGQASHLARNNGGTTWH